MQLIRKGGTRARTARRSGCCAGTASSRWPPGCGFEEETDGDYWRGLRQLLAYDPDQIQLLYVTPHRWTPFFGQAAHRRVIQTTGGAGTTSIRCWRRATCPPWRVLLWVKFIEAVGALAVERGPAVRGGEDRHDLVGVVGQKVAQHAPVVGVGLFLEPHAECAKPDHPVLAQKRDRLPVLGAGPALADGLQGRLVGALQPQKKPQAARAFVKRQKVGVAHDVIGAGRADDA